MSRHSFNQDDGGCAAIGWDAPMNTFYLQLDENDDEPSLWLGNEYGQVQEPDALVDIIRKVSGDVPDDLIATLLADRRAEPAWDSIDDRLADGSMRLTFQEPGKLPYRMPRTTTLRSLFRKITGRDSD